MNIGESSDDNLRSARAQQAPKTEAWIDAFNAQCTEALLKRLRRYALLLARLPGGDLLGDATSYAEEQVQTVVTDVVDRVLRWDPFEKDLESYLTDVIRLRVKRDRRRAGRYEHVSIDATHAQDTGSLIHEVEKRLTTSASARDDEEATGSGEMTAMMKQFRELVSFDELALRFLDAIDQGAVGRAEIMKFARLTRAEYHNTRRRMARLLANRNHGRRESTEGN